MKRRQHRLRTDGEPARDRFTTPALVIFFVALSVRLIHIWQIRRAPFFAVLMGDSRGYDAWAQRIAGGDWLGSDVFYQAPLYPYFLGTIYTLAGRDLVIVRICQAILGSAACGMLGLAAWRLWSRTAGLVAGLGLALYAPAIFFDGLLQKAVLDTFFVCLALWLMSEIIAPGTNPDVGSGSSRISFFRTWLFLGLAMAGLALTRENAMVFVAVILLWILVGRIQAPRPAAAAFLLGLTLVLAPVALRNYLVGGGFYVTTAQFGPNFYLGNNPTADGTAQSLRVGRGSAEYERQDATELAEHAMGRRLTPGEVSQYWTDRALTFITSQPGAWLKLMTRKFALLWNATEMLDTESQESYADWSTPVRVGALVGHFGVLMPLALLGVLATWHERTRLWVLYAMVAAYAASVLMFFIYARYRFPLVPFLMLFAAVGVMALTELIKYGAPFWPAPAAIPSRGPGEPRLGISVNTRWGWPAFAPPALRRVRRSSRAREASGGGGPSATEKKTARHGRGRSPVSVRVPVAVAALIAATVFTNWPVLSPALMRAVTEHNLGAALQSDGRVDDAIDHYRRALAFKADHAPALNNLGTALAAKGDVEQAITHYEQALAIEPDYASAHYNLANAFLNRGKPDKAADHFRRALQSAPGSAEVHNNLGIALTDEGRFDEAISEFQRALAFDPNSTKAHRSLANALASTGKRDEAIEALRRAVALDPRDGPAHYDLATLLVEAQRMPEAVEEFRAALEVMPDSVDVYNNLGIALASQGRLDEAIEMFRRALSLQPDFAPARGNLAAARQQQNKN